MINNEINLSFITETWLKDTITDSVVNIPGFTIICKDRFVNSHGRICIYIREGNTKFKSLSEISCCPEHEILWLHIKPKRLPHEFSSIIAVVLYHPPRADDTSMLNHLFHSLSKIEVKFHNCGIIIAGYFNHLNVNSIKKHIVKSPTRGEATLDLVLTNMHEFYKSPQVFPPIGLSDHNTIVVSPACKVKKSKIYICVQTGPSSKPERSNGEIFNVNSMVHDLCSNTKLQSYN